MLRYKVKALDAKLGKRSFGDKGEWAQALALLQQEGVLTHAVDTDTVMLSVATMEVDVCLSHSECDGRQPGTGPRGSRVSSGG